MSIPTPGPWKVHKKPVRIGFAEYEIHYSDDGECVADVVYEEGDAHLIAAAPDMYKALKDMLAAFGNTENDAIEKGRKALTKARGELNGRQ